MVNSYLPENTPKNRLRAYRLTDVVFALLAAAAALIWYTQEVPELPPTPLEAQVDDLTRSLKSLDAQQKGTVGYLIEQRQELEEQFQLLAPEIKE